MPAYTYTASTSERVLQSAAYPRLLAGDHEWVYKTDHMSINLGARLWGLHAPSYGLNGKVEGAVTLIGEHHHVERVTATVRLVVDYRMISFVDVFIFCSWKEKSPLSPLTEAQYPAIFLRHCSRGRSQYMLLI